MPLFLLVRHGENEYVKKGRLAGRLPGVHLNDKGRAQAQAVAHMLAEKFKEVPVKAIYSSPMERTLETAEPIARALGLEVVQRPGLIEVDVGEWQDQKLKGLSRLKVWRVVQNAPSLFRFPGGETFVNAQHRIIGELMDLACQWEPKDAVICVSHSDPIKLAVSYFIGQPLDLFQRLSVSPASITALFLSSGSSQLVTLNYEVSYISPER